MRISKTIKIAIIFVLLVVLLAILNLAINKIKNFFYLISSPIQKSLWRAGDKTSDFFETITTIKKLKTENEELKLKTQELLAKNIALTELEKENKILREALGVGLEKEFSLILAEVIGKDISQDSILIDKGVEDGLSNNLPVITEQKALIGRIDEVYAKFSRVILISNKESIFNAKIQSSEENFNNDIAGVVKGKGNLQFSLELVSREKEIKEGDLLITTSLGGIFPKGLLIGQIQNVKKSDIEPFWRAEIKPAFDLKELEAVFIIK